MLEQADEVQEALGRQYGMPELDDDELNAELDALGKWICHCRSSYNNEVTVEFLRHSLFSYV